MTASDGKWTFPVVAWRGYSPTRSQEYRAADHHGVDVMFRRDGKDDVAYAAGTPNGSKNFFMPDGVDVVAARDGTLWSAGLTDTGHFVTLDHGKPYATLYLHLDTLAVPATKAGAGGVRIHAGQKLGTVGASPRDREGLKHLHFEVWVNGDHESHVDPWPYIGDAPLARSWTRLAALLAALLALVGLSRKGPKMPTS